MASARLREQLTKTHSIMLTIAKAEHPHLLLGTSPDSQAIAELLLAYGAFAFLVLLIIGGLLLVMKKRYSSTSSSPELRAPLDGPPRIARFGKIRKW